MAISVEQWTKIEKALGGLYWPVKFRLDGHELAVRWERISVNSQKYVLVVYIDGTIKIGAGHPNLGHYDPFTEKVWRKRTLTISLFKKRDMEGKTKREIAVCNSLRKQFPDKVNVWYDCCFNTTRSLIKQYKTLDGLELVEEEDNNG